MNCIQRPFVSVPSNNRAIDRSIERSENGDKSLLIQHSAKKLQAMNEGTHDKTKCVGVQEMQHSSMLRQCLCAKANVLGQA